MNILLVGCAQRILLVQVARNVVNTHFTVVVGGTHPTSSKVTQ
jgi:hypothetical protein